MKILDEYKQELKVENVKFVVAQRNVNHVIAGFRNFPTPDMWSGSVPFTLPQPTPTQPLPFLLLHVSPQFVSEILSILCLFFCRFNYYFHRFSKRYRQYLCQFFTEIRQQTKIGPHCKKSLLLSVSPRFVIEFLPIFWLLFCRFNWNLHISSQHFGRTLYQNFIKIGWQIKIFSIDLYNRISEKVAHRLHCTDFYNRRLRATFLPVVWFEWNLDTEFI